MTIKDKELEAEWLSYIKPVLENEEFQKRKTFEHHGDISVWDHSLRVSKLAFILAKRFHSNPKNAAISGILHDFYYEDWTKKAKVKLSKAHGFVHAREARDNSRKHFPELMNSKIEDAIRKHMFPLNIKPPRYSTGWIVTLADKLISTEVFRHPLTLYRYIGIAKRNKK